jgi:hypothetical protein
MKSFFYLLGPAYRVIESFQNNKTRGKRNVQFKSRFSKELQKMQIIRRLTCTARKKSAKNFRDNKKKQRNNKCWRPHKMPSMHKIGRVCGFRKTENSGINVQQSIAK